MPVLRPKTIPPKSNEVSDCSTAIPFVLRSAALFEDKCSAERAAPPPRFPSAASLINAPHAPGAVQSAQPPAGHSVQRKPSLLKSKWDSYLDESAPLQPSVSVTSHTLQLAPSDWDSKQHPHSSLLHAPLQRGNSHASFAQGELGGHASKRLKRAAPSGMHGHRCSDNFQTLDTSHPVHLELMREQLSSCSVCVASIQPTCTQEPSEPHQQAGKKSLHLGVMCILHPEGTQPEVLATLPVFGVGLDAHRRPLYKPALEMLARLVFNSKAPHQQQSQQAFAPKHTKPLLLTSDAQGLVRILLPYFGTPFVDLAPPMVVDPRVLARILSKQASLDADSLAGSVTAARKPDTTPLDRLREDCLRCVRLAHICGAQLCDRVPRKAVKEAMQVELLPALDASGLPALPHLR